MSDSTKTPVERIPTLSKTTTHRQRAKQPKKLKLETSRPILPGEEAQSLENLVAAANEIYLGLQNWGRLPGHAKRFIEMLLDVLHLLPFAVQDTKEWALKEHGPSSAADYLYDPELDSPLNHCENIFDKVDVFLGSYYRDDDTNDTRARLPRLLRCLRGIRDQFQEFEKRLYLAAEAEIDGREEDAMKHHNEASAFVVTIQNMVKEY
jgi:hypothetical protein